MKLILETVLSAVVGMLLAIMFVVYRPPHEDNVQILVAVGLLFGMTGYIVQSYRELQQLRAMKKFLVENWPLAEGQALVNRVLGLDARLTASQSALIIRFQKGGLQAVADVFPNLRLQEVKDHDVSHEATEVGRRLDEYFKRRQSIFFQDYDLIARFGDLLSLDLLARDWKVYAESEKSSV